MISVERLFESAASWFFYLFIFVVAFLFVVAAAGQINKLSATFVY